MNARGIEDEVEQEVENCRDTGRRSKPKAAGVEIRGWTQQVTKEQLNRVTVVTMSQSMTLPYSIILIPH